MTLTLDFPPEMESQLQTLAGQRGTSIEEMALQVLAAGLHEMRDESAPVVFSQDRQTRNAQIRALLRAPAAVRAATLAHGSAALADDYAHDAELTEFTTALQGEDFHDAD